MKRTDRDTVRESEGRRFRTLAALCQGVTRGIGSPMFELKRSAWKRGYRCGSTKVDSKIERPRIGPGASQGSQTLQFSTQR
jgi:hypothetical protein